LKEESTEEEIKGKKVWGRIGNRKGGGLRKIDMNSSVRNSS